jgi:pyrroloquinoline quinone (PQQ) biosynthesis protein C
MSGQADDLLHEPLTPSAFVDRLQAIAEASRAANHPLLLAIAEGEFDDPRYAIRRFVGEYYFYSRRFTQALGAVMSALDAPEHRAWLTGNTAEEAGVLDAGHERELRAAGIDPEFVKAPHPELFKRFLRAAGLPPDDLAGRTPLVATCSWVETFLAVCRHGGQEQAVGALGVATEGIVGHMYRYVLAGIKQAWPDMPLYDRVFFDLHAAVDDDHADVLRRIAVAFARTPEGRRQLAVGAVKALNARATFFDEMLAHVRAGAAETYHERVA